MISCKQVTAKLLKLSSSPGAQSRWGWGLPSVCILLGQKGTWRHQGCQLHLWIIHYFCVVPLNSPSVMATSLKYLHSSEKNLWPKTWSSHDRLDTHCPMTIWGKHGLHWSHIFQSIPWTLGTQGFLFVPFNTTHCILLGITSCLLLICLICLQWADKFLEKREFVLR